MIVPPPMKTSAKVPTNSAMKWRQASFIVGRLEWGCLQVAENVRVSGAGSHVLPSLCALQHQRRIDPPEPEGVREHVIDRGVAARAGDVIQIAALVGLLEVERRRQPSRLERQRANGGLHGAGRAERVAVVALGAAHLKLRRMI